MNHPSLQKRLVHKYYIRDLWYSRSGWPTKHMPPPLHQSNKATKKHYPKIVASLQKGEVKNIIGGEYQMDCREKRVVSNFSLHWFTSGASVDWTHRSKLTELAFPSLFLGSIFGFSLSLPELKTTLNLALKPIRIITKLIFTDE